MNGGSRRQWILLAGLSVAVFAYFRYGVASFSFSGEDVGELPRIESGTLVKMLRDISTVQPKLFPPPPGLSDPDRNLFQYGERRPPPPPPMTEAERKAAEDELRKAEAAAREAKAAEEARQAEADAAAAKQAELLAQQQAQAQPPPPPQPPPQPVKQAPPINYRFVGIMGPATKKVGVFMEGEKMVLARKGEVIDGKFKVLGIGPEWADMGYVDPDFKGKQQRLNFGQ